MVQAQDGTTEGLPGAGDYSTASFLVLRASASSNRAPRMILPSA